MRAWRPLVPLLVAGLLATVALVAGAGGVASAAAADPPPAEPPPGSGPEVDLSVSPDPIAHDPTMIRQGRYHYQIITGDIDSRTYLPIRRSTDLVHWTFLGTVFTTPPAWVVDELGITPGDFWAPDINYFDGEYHLYYAASSFGTNNSVIGLATNVTLDPADPRYEWVDRGMVLRSRAGDDVNAIDADVVFDRDGVPWLSYGSFWDGIRMRRLDASTGLLSTRDATEHRLASRGGRAIEGPSITYHRGWYYLFVSFDFCCRGVNSDYRVMVGRSRQVTGPYVDRAGVPMLDGGGTELLRGYHGFAGPGHGDVYGSLYVHHYYDAADRALPKGSVRVLSWADGWPRLSDPLSGNRGFGHGPAYVRVVHRGSGAVLANASCGYEGADITLAAPARPGPRGSRAHTASPADQPPGDPCQQWRPDPRGDGYVSLGNRHSNKVVEVAGCVDADGARVAQWGWLANDCQRFRLVPTADGWFRVENAVAGRALQPARCDAGAGTAVQTFAPADGPCQEFRLDPVGEVLLADGANERLAGCAAFVVVTRSRAGSCQRWRFVHLDEGWFAVVSAASGRPMTAARSGSVVLGARGFTGPAARWRVEALGAGGYRLVNQENRALVLGRGVARHAPVGGPGQEVLLLTP